MLHLGPSGQGTKLLILYIKINLSQILENRQFNHKFAALARFALGNDSSFVQFGDSFGNGEPQAVAVSRFFRA